MHMYVQLYLNIYIYIYIYSLRSGAVNVRGVRQRVRVRQHVYFQQRVYTLACLSMRSTDCMQVRRETFV